MIPNWKYQTAKAAVVPYAHNDINDGLLGHLYLRTKQDHLLDTVWAGLPGVNFDQFVSQLSSSKVALQIYYLQQSSLLPIGYCFLYQIDGEPGERLAQLGFCFFREYWGIPEVHECGWLCIAYWFEAIQVDVLYGATEIDNILARNFSRKFGFKEAGIAPKFLRTSTGRKDGRIVYLERDTFLPLLETWRKRNTLND